jgi:5-methylthioadenosine/S-adenosylhomocysteine deaminase
MPPNEDWIRPFGMIIDGVLERGLEIAVVDGVVQDIRATTDPCEPFILSPAFVNAHSHLEYRGMLNQIEHPEYYEWIYELTRLKQLESAEFVREQCDLAAQENVRAGVKWIGEHSDRPGSAEAMSKHGLGGWIFQEVITAGSPDVDATIAAIESKLEATKATVASTSLSPHAYFTVNHDTLRRLGAQDAPISIHVAETEHETNFTKFGKGPIAERRMKFGVPFEVYNQSVVEVINDLGVLRPGTQCVHCCSVDDNDISILAGSGVTIAHCPRSNIRLQCPDAPVREFLAAGITVGLGLDSPASGGEIDMFAEMRAALEVSERRGKPLTGEEVWRMATSQGYRSFGRPSDTKWDIYVGSTIPLIRIGIVEDVPTTKALIHKG